MKIEDVRNGEMKVKFQQNSSIRRIDNRGGSRQRSRVPIEHFCAQFLEKQTDEPTGIFIPRVPTETIKKFAIFNRR